MNRFIPVIILVLTLGLWFGTIGAPAAALGGGATDTDVGSSSAASGSVSQGGDGSVQIAVSAQYTPAGADGSGGDGGTVSSQAVTASVHPVCWYMEGLSGAETAKWLDSPDGAASDMYHRNNNNPDPEGLEEQKARYPDYESYADDEEGYWYVAT
ncbi:Hypothetical protein ACGLYG10_0833, partial [Actinomyces glycerinitolerans]